MKIARENAGLSQKQVALEIGVSAPTVSDWEAGKIYPSVKNLMLLSKLFCVTTDYLLGIEKKEKEPTAKDSEPSQKEILYRAYLAADPGVQASVRKLLDLPSVSSAKSLA